MNLTVKECDAQISEYSRLARLAREQLRVVNAQSAANFTLGRPWRLNAALSQHKSALIALAESYDNLVEAYDGLRPNE